MPDENNPPSEQNGNRPSLLKHESQIQDILSANSSINAVLSLYSELLEDIKQRLAVLEAKIKGQ